MHQETNERDRRLNRVFLEAERRILERAPSKVEAALVAKAGLLLEEGAYAEARAMMEAEQPALSNDPPALQVLGLALLGLEEHQEARSILRRSIELLHKQLSGAYSNLALVACDSGAYADAVEAAHEAVQWYGQWAGPWVNALMAHCARQDREAIEVEVSQMRTAWPGWETDENMRERIEQDSSLGFIRKTDKLRRLFPDWLPQGG